MPSPVRISIDQAAVLRVAAWAFQPVPSVARELGVNPRSARHVVNGDNRRWNIDTLGVPPVPKGNLARRAYTWDPAAGVYVDTTQAARRA